jgi:hypothetical protein
MWNPCWSVLRPRRQRLTRIGGSLSLGLGMLLAADVAHGQYSDISLTVATDHASYVLGTPVEITVTANNASATPVTIPFGSTLQAQYAIDEVYTTPLGGATIPTSITIPANGSYAWQFDHRLDYYELSVGQHSVVGILRQLEPSNRFSPPHLFEVTLPPPPITDVALDFETLPNGSPSMETVLPRHAYAAQGVEISSDVYVLTIRENRGNRTLYTPSAGANIVAKFAMPVYGVSADVGTAAGRTVSMMAFDAANNLLGTVESAMVADFRELVGPLEFTSSVPIASVQWHSSDINAAVSVDNLRLDVAVPEPSAAAMMLTAAFLVRSLGSRRLSQGRF